MPYKLLLADDNKDLVKVLQRRLSEEGYEVVVAFGGQEALAKVKEDKPDIILLDLMMPEFSGFEVLKEIKKMREENKDKRRPVIIISGKGELEDVVKCYNLEADQYLNKPFSIEDMLNAIKKMISLISSPTKYK